MAKVIRSRWVYRPDNKWHRYLPRRVDTVKEFDYNKKEATLSDYAREISDDLKPAEPSKLWMAWLYRDVNGQPKWTKNQVVNLFGPDYKVGKMDVFRNTPLINEELWKIKHLIELRPVVFKNGEPGLDDVYATKLHPNGECEIVPNGEVSNEPDLRLFDEKKQWSRKDIGRDLAKKHHRMQSVMEMNVYTPSNITIVK